MKAFTASNMKKLAYSADMEFSKNEDYIGKVLDRIQKLSQCGIGAVCIQFQDTAEYAEYEKVEEILIELGYVTELYSSYLQVKWA